MSTLSASSTKLRLKLTDDDGTIVVSTLDPVSSESKDSKIPENKVELAPDGVENRITDPKASLKGDIAGVTVGGIMKWPATKIYPIRMNRAATLTTGGGGTMNLSTPVFPSQFDQYTQIQNLFQYCRLKRIRIEYQPNISPANSTAIPAVMAIGFQSAFSGAGTPTFLGALRLQNSRCLSSAQTNWPVVIEYKPPRDMPWSITANNGSGSDPLGGSPGQFWHCVNGAVSASTTYFTYIMYADYEFRLLQ